MTRLQSIAVVGSGISGLGAAWLLSRNHDVTLFESDDRLGGHSNTVDVPTHDGSVAVDTGFIVYNTASYPNLIALFAHLDVPTAATDMGFAVSLADGDYEYSGDGLAGLFGQYSNIANPSHWRMIANIRRFFQDARAVLADPAAVGHTLGEYLISKRYSEAFINRHILPMAAAIWSTPSGDVLQFPVQSFVRFFDNHGLLQVNNRPQWRTVVGGSRSYIKRILATSNVRIVLQSPIRSIARTPYGVTVTHSNGAEHFDGCVVATHADDALALLADPDERERTMLQAFSYTANRAVLHSDAAQMPKRRRLWSSWNYLGTESRSEPPSLTYWMNKLQPLETSKNIFVTINPHRDLAAQSTIASFNYRHPMFDRAAMAAQRELWQLQGRRHTWFCGSYFGYGFHEDGLQSGLAVAEAIGSPRRPWQVSNANGHIYVNAAHSATEPDLAAAQ